MKFFVALLQFLLNKKVGVSVGVIKNLFLKRIECFSLKLLRIYLKKVLTGLK